MPGTRVVLSVGPDSRRKMVSTLFLGGTGVALLTLAIFRVIDVSLFKERTVVSAGSGTPTEVENIPGPAATLFDLFGLLCCAVPVVLLAFYLMLRTWMTPAWVEDTTVHLRGALLRTRSVDLATADATLSQAGPPVLTLTDQNGQTVKLPLHGWAPRRTVGPVLPAVQLRALADALEAGESDRSRAVAAQLRTMADSPAVGG